MIFNYLKIFIRFFRKSPLLNSFNMLGITVALSMTLATMIYVLNELSFDRHFSQADSIYRMTYRFANDAGYDIHWARMNQDWVNEMPNAFPQIEELIRFQDFRPRNVIVGDQKFREEYAYSVDSDVFQLFDFEFIAGRPEQALSQPNSIVLTESTAFKYFGDIDPIGKQVTTMREGNKTNHLVTGVIEDPSNLSHLPITFLSSINSEEERKGWAYIYVLLNEQSKIEDLATQMDDFLVSRDENLDELTVHFQPLTDIHLHSDLSRELKANGNVDYIILFSAVSILLLLISGINFANFNVVKALTRTKEIGLRRVLGAASLQVRGLLFTEVTLLLVASAALSIVIVMSQLPQLNELVGYQLQVNWLEITPILLVMLVVMLLLAAVYPAQVALRDQPIKALAGKSKMPVGSGVFQKVLLTVQFVVVIGLLSGTLIINRQFQFLTEKQLGFAKDNLLVIPNFNYPINDHYEALKSDLLGIPGVTDVTALMEMPSRPIKDEGQVRVKGRSEEEIITTDIQVMDINGLEMLEMPLLAGTSLSPSLKNVEYDPEQDFFEFLRTKPRNYLINEKAMQMLGWSSPDEALEHEIQWSIGDVALGYGRVVGVVGNYHQESLKAAIDPVVMTYEPMWLQNVMIKTEGSNPYGLRSQIEEAWQNRFPDYPLELRYLDEEVEGIYQSEQKQRLLISTITMVAFMITILGLLGLVGFSLETRLKELAIRKVLGANFKQLVWLIGSEYSRLVVVSLLMTIPLIWYVASEWLNSYAYHINLDGTSFGLTFTLVLAVIALIVYVQCLKVDFKDPSSVLRSE